MVGSAVCALPVPLHHAAPCHTLGPPRKTKSTASVFELAAVLNRAARLRIGSQISEARRSSTWEVSRYSIVGTSGSALQRVGFQSGADMDPRLNEALLDPRCSPSVEVALGSNYSANVLGVLDNFHFAKLLTVCRYQLIATIAAMMYPTAPPMIEVETSHQVHHHKRRRKGGHQQPEGRSRHRNIISIGTRRGLKKVLGIRVSWDDRIV